jgi:transcriptional regulator with XRE-family HTH domain
MDFRQQLGVNLRRLREEAGLSQEGLMWLSDVHRTQISKYERGETEPQAEVLARLSRALGVSAEDFFAGVRWQDSPPRLVVGRLGDSRGSESIRPRLPHGSSAATFPFGG